MQPNLSPHLLLPILISQLSQFLQRTLIIPVRILFAGPASEEPKLTTCVGSGSWNHIAGIIFLDIYIEIMKMF